MGRKIALGNGDSNIQLAQKYKGKNEKERKKKKKNIMEDVHHSC